MPITVCFWLRKKLLQCIVYSLIETGMQINVIERITKEFVVQGFPILIAQILAVIY